MAGFVRWLKSFIGELRRRRVIRVAVVYATTAFVILQLGEILVEPFGLGDWSLRLITLLLVLGFPLAVGLAWVYNITEEGVVREVGEAAAIEAASERSPFTSNGLIVGLLIIAIGLLLYPRVFPSGDDTAGQESAPETTQIDERSIAVLPFEPLSGGEKTETFARGVHDDLLTRLSNISDLTVTSRTSVEQYRNKDLPLPAIADSLGVRWVMEGGVLESGGQIQVNAQLIDPKSDAHVWAEDYQRKLTPENLFAIQGEITREIADALKAKLTAKEQSRITGAPTENLQAYRLYVQGRNHLDRRTEAGTRQALESFQRALGKDSSYALAWVGLADALDLSRAYGYGIPDSIEVRPEQAVRRALAIDSTLAEAYASLGYVRLREKDGPGVIRARKRAVKLKPSYARGHQWLGSALGDLGRLEEGLPHLKRAVELDPLSPVARIALGMGYYFNGQLREALSQARRARELVPELGEAHLFEGVALCALEREEEALTALRRGLERSRPESTFRDHLAPWVGVAHAQEGNSDRAREILTTLEGQSGGAYGRGIVYAALGDVNAALDAFQEAAFAGVWFRSSMLRYAPVLEPIRNDPRYEDLIREINMSWGLNPDGSLPEDAGTLTEPETDA